MKAGLSKVLRTGLWYYLVLVYFRLLLLRLFIYSNDFMYQVFKHIGVILAFLF